MAINLTPKQAELVARLAYAEDTVDAGNQIGHMHVILTRLRSDDYPGTLEGVIYQKNAFEPIRSASGKANMASLAGPALEARMAMAQAVFAGEIPDPSGGSHMFGNTVTMDQRGTGGSHKRAGETTQMGRHTFFGGDSAAAKAVQQSPEFQAAVAALQKDISISNAEWLKAYGGKKAMFEALAKLVEDPTTAAEFTEATKGWHSHGLHETLSGFRSRDTLGLTDRAIRENGLLDGYEAENEFLSKYLDKMPENIVDMELEDRQAALEKAVKEGRLVKENGKFHEASKRLGVDMDAYDKERGVLAGKDAENTFLENYLEKTSEEIAALSDEDRQSALDKAVEEKKLTKDGDRYIDPEKAEFGPESQKLMRAVQDQVKDLKENDPDAFGDLALEFAEDQRKRREAEQKKNNDQHSLDQRVANGLSGDLEDLFTAVILGLFFGPEVMNHYLGAMNGGTGPHNGPGSLANGRPGNGVRRGSNGQLLDPGEVFQGNLGELANRTLQGDSVAGQGVEFARRFLGQTDNGNNRSAMTKLVGSYGLPWCGGYVDFVYDNAVDKRLFTHGSRLSARSYEDVGKKHGSWEPKRNGYVPQVMDTVTFWRNGGSMRHVGIVTAVDEARGTFTYISGNTGRSSDRVLEKEYSYRNPPGRLQGFVNIRDLAKAKGLDIDFDKKIEQPMVERGKGPQVGDGSKVVILDMGHINAKQFGEAVGARGEVDFIRSIAPKIVSELEGKGWKVIKTWEEPEAQNGLSNSERAKIQSRYPGVPYLSVHADARNAGGAEFVYNAPAYRDQNDVTFAKSMAAGMQSAGIKLKGDGHHGYRGNNNPYKTIQGSNPNLFFEAGAITSSSGGDGPDRAKLFNAAYQEQLAQGLSHGLEAYYDRHMKPKQPPKKDKTVSSSRGGQVAELVKIASLGEAVQQAILEAKIDANGDGQVSVAESKEAVKDGTIDGIKAALKESGVQVAKSVDGKTTGEDLQLALKAAADKKNAQDAGADKEAVQAQ